MTDLPPLETEPRSTESPGPSDAELITAVRSGRTAAFGPLYDRHVGAARALARQLTRDPNEAEDLVSEAFAKVLAVVQAGGGPDVAFRAYLLTALRRNAYDRTRAGSRVQVSDDMTAYDPGVPFVDPALEGLERSIVSRAYTSLPERWQTVLWHTEVEGLTPAQVAPLLGLTANGVAALAYRAREGLRQAYLQQHLTGPLEDDCRPYSDRLGAYARGGLSKRETAQVESHLETCSRCRALVLELTDVGSGMRAVIAPLVLGLAVAGYLSSGALLGTGSAAGAATLAGSGSGAGIGGGTTAASGGAAAAGTAGAGGTGVAAAAAAGVVGAGALTAAAAAGARPAAASTGTGAGGGSGGGGGPLSGGPGTGGAAGGGGALPGVTVTAAGGSSSSGLFGLAGGGWLAGAAAAAVGLVGAGIVAAVVIGGGGGGDHTTGAPPAASGPALPGGAASSGTPTATSSSGSATSATVTTGTPGATATATPTARSTSTARPSASATATPAPTTSPSTSPSGGPTGSPTGTPTGTPSGSPSGSPTGTSPSPSPSPTSTGKTTLVVTYTPLGDLVQGRPGVIGFSIDNTGHSAAGLITADVTLPAGVQFVGQQTSGAAIANLSPSGDWTCDGTDTGATCTRNALLAGETTQVYLDVDAQAGSAGTTPVTVTVSSSGLASVTVGSTHGVQAGGLAARYAATGPLKVAEVGNGLLSCPTAEAGCADARQGTGVLLDDDDWSMTPYNQAGDQTNASSAVDLQVPAGATVRWAGLYWSGGFVPGTTQETLKLRGPGSADYTTVTAEQTDMGTQSSWQVFQSYADVTNLVVAGGAGTWWGADPQVLAGTSKYAGWSLVVVYDDPTAPQDQVTVFDGLAAVANDGQPQSFVVAPRASGKARIGTVAWEGDLGISGDAISLDGTDLVPQGGTQDPANVMDSSAAGAIGPTNTFGTDVDSFWADVATADNPVVTARTTGDTYFLGVLTVSDR